MEARQARLDDTSAISALFRAAIETWQRLGADGRVEDMGYEALTVYERWLHGNALHAGEWMSIETAAIHLNRLLRGAGIPLVAVEDGRVAGYLEAYVNDEGEPFGSHLHIAHLRAEQPSAASALMAALKERAKALKLRQLTVSSSDPNNDAIAAALRQTGELRRLAVARRFSLPARTGQGFYRAVDYRQEDAAQIAGWVMSAGRLTSARHLWETLWPGTFETMPELRRYRTHRLRLAAGGQDALVLCQQHMYDPRAADFFIWTLKGLAGPTVTALRDWAHREGYRTLWLIVLESAIKALGPDAEPDAFSVETHAADIK